MAKNEFYQVLLWFCINIIKVFSVSKFFFFNKELFIYLFFNNDLYGIK